MQKMSHFALHSPLSEVHMEPMVDLQCIVNDLGLVMCSKWCVVVEWEVSYPIHYEVNITRMSLFQCIVAMTMM
jgi:hypothetical protein